MNLKIKLFIIVIILLISGLFFNRYIADVSALEKINITVDSIQIEELQLKYCKLRFNINIINPTSVDISELSVNFDTFIANIYIGNGRIPKITIPMSSQKSSNISLTIYYADVGIAVIEGIQSRNFILTVDGIAKVNVLFNLISISKSFSASYSYP